MTAARRPSKPRLITLVIALAVLSIALTFDNAWPTAGIVPIWALSIEMLVVVLALVFLATRDRRPPPRWLGALAAVYLVFVVLHYIDVTVPALFGRPINLFWDGRHLPQVLKLAASEQPMARVVGVVIAAVVAIGLGWWLLRWALTVVWRSATSARQPLLAAIPLIALIAATITVRVAGGDFGLQHVAQPVSTVYTRQASWLASIAWPGAIDRWLPQGPRFDGALRALDGADVMVLFLESYGATTFDDPALAGGLAGARGQLQQVIDAKGRQVVSAFVRSPTFGGGSWLAHSSLLSGIDMHEPERYALLLASQRPSLIGHFRAHGYRTVALMPGLRSAWPEGGFYGFDTIYDSHALGYDGPDFGFWRIPDEFSIGRLHELEFGPQAAPRGPRLVVFPTINSHIPFDPVPPLAGGSPRAFAQSLDPEAVRRALATVPDWTNLGPAYARSIDYSLRWLAGYLDRQAPPGLVLVAIGDHQPAASVSGRGASWDVPVHVISTRADLLERFIAAGFRPGLAPQRPAIGAMHELTPLLLAAFDGCPPATRSVPAVGPAAITCEPSRVDIPGTRVVGQRGDPVADRAGIAPAVRAQAQRLAD